jgi:hypothetical protein
MYHDEHRSRLENHLSSAAKSFSSRRCGKKRENISFFDSRADECSYSTVICDYGRRISKFTCA